MTGLLIITTCFFSASYFSTLRAFELRLLTQKSLYGGFRCTNVWRPYTCRFSFYHTKMFHCYVSNDCFFGGDLKSKSKNIEAKDADLRTLNKKKIWFFSLFLPLALFPTHISYLCCLHAAPQRLCGIECCWYWVIPFRIFLWVCVCVCACICKRTPHRTHIHIRTHANG